MVERDFDEAYAEDQAQAEASLSADENSELEDEQIEDIYDGLQVDEASEPVGRLRAKRCTCGSAMILMKDPQGYFYRCPECRQEFRVVVG